MADEKITTKIGEEYLLKIFEYTPQPNEKGLEMETKE